MVIQSQAAPVLHTYGNAQGEGSVEPMKGPEIGFNDFLRALNPLQHIPVVGFVWRQVTGETIEPAFRVAGGAILGGPIGAILSAVSAFAERALGLDGEPTTAVAAADAGQAGPTQTATTDASAAEAPTLQASAEPVRRRRSGSAGADASSNPMAAAQTAPNGATLAQASASASHRMPGAATALPQPSAALATPGAASPGRTAALPTLASAPALSSGDVERRATMAARDARAPAGARSRWDASDRPDPLYEAALRLQRASPVTDARGAMARPIVTADARLPARRATQEAEPVAARANQAPAGRELQGIRFPGPTPLGEDFTSRVVGGLAAYDRTARMRAPATP